MAAGTLVSSGSSGSMPTGSGSERVCRASIHALNNQAQTILTGLAGHIYTILSIVFCDQQGATGTLNIKINDGSNDIAILSGQTHGSEETFIWSDRIALEENDYLEVYNTVTSGDWYVSYIDQNWV